MNQSIGQTAAEVVLAKTEEQIHVCEYFPSTLTRKESDERVHSWKAKVEARGWGLWAVSAPGIADFIGFM